MTKLSREDVLKLAYLARLNLNEDEIDRYRNELSEIINYVDMLQSVDVDKLQPTDQVNGQTNVERDDVVRQYGYDPRNLLNNVPRVKDYLIETKRMIG